MYLIFAPSSNTPIAPLPASVSSAARTQATPFRRLFPDGVNVVGLLVGGAAGALLGAFVLGPFGALGLGAVGALFGGAYTGFS